MILTKNKLSNLYINVRAHRRLALAKMKNAMMTF